MEKLENVVRSIITSEASATTSDITSEKAGWQFIAENTYGAAYWNSKDGRVCWYPDSGKPKISSPKNITQKSTTDLSDITSEKAGWQFIMENEKGGVYWNSISGTICWYPDSGKPKITSPK